MELEFDPDTSRVCININIINNLVLEDNIDEFYAVLITNDPHVIVSPDSETLTIADDDS